MTVRILSAKFSVSPFHGVVHQIVVSYRPAGHVYIRVLYERARVIGMGELECV